MQTQSWPATGDVLTAPAPLSATPYIAVVSDFRGGWPPAEKRLATEAHAERAWRAGERGQAPGAAYRSSREVEVLGGYLERLPLACVRAGLVDQAEVWSWWRAEAPPAAVRQTPWLTRRVFQLSDETPPFRSADMLGFIRAFGAPHILCAWGLGVAADVLDACAASFKIYNSIDAPALRAPPELCGRCDLILTAAEWQSDEVRALLPEATVEVLPIGPEFADPITFRPLGIPKFYDVIYVAAAQPYKQHGVLFDALARSPQPLKALCVFGYGELADDLRREAARRRLDVDFVGPPGVDFAEVNRLMNNARVGVVCGEHDGAPAVLTEYMLAGLPVLANAKLRCGLQYVTPKTGAAAAPERFHEGLLALLDRTPRLDPRRVVLDRWTWPHSIERLEALMARTAKGRMLLDRAVRRKTPPP